MSHSLRRVEQIIDYFRAQSKGRDNLKVGLEHEKFGIRPSSLSSLPFDGPGGIEEILLRLHRLRGYERTLENGRTIGLEADGTKFITLEPGGQLELSGMPKTTIPELEEELRNHLTELREVSEDLDCVWLALGRNPLVPLEEIPWMPKKRYRIMRSYMPRRGSRGLYMMKMTATVQANLDYTDEEDACRKLRISMGLSPIVTALFANSSITPGLPLDGKPAMDRRYLEWLDTDPDRCGLLDFVFRPEFRFREYADWLLDVPIYFLVRDGKLIDCSGESFRRLVERGEATMDDFELHMSTVFPEVRLKGFIEVRGADAGPSEMLLALPALWKGLLYDDRALEQAWKLVADQSFPERLQFARDVGFFGLRARTEKGTALDLATELVEIAANGLKRQACLEEVGYLEPLRIRIRRGMSLARESWLYWTGEWETDPESLIKWSRIA